MGERRINIKAIARQLARAQKRLPPVLANMIKNHFRRSFRLGGFEGDRFEKWPRRKRSIKGMDRRGGRRALMVESGFLRNSIRVRTATWDVIKVGTYNTDYASTHNEGLTTRPVVTNKMRKWAWAQFKKNGSKMAKGIALTSKDRLTVPHPKRRFMGRSKMLDSKLKARIRKEINIILVD